MLLTCIIVAARRACTTGCMRGQYTFVDEGLQTSTTVPNGPLPVLAGSPPAQILKLTRRVPSVFMLYATASAARAQAHFEEFCSGCFTPDWQHVQHHGLFGPIGSSRRGVIVSARIGAVLMILTIDLLLNLLKLLLYIGRYLFRGLLLNNYRL